MNNRICIFTGTRAEFGLLKPLMDLIQTDPDLKLQIIASGSHLSHEFGETYKEIESEGFLIDEKVEMLMSSDTPVGVCKSMGLGFIGYSEALSRLNPDLLVVLGDRFEAFSLAASATICRIPIAHIHGGEITQGVYDEAFRHSITKMSHLHFTSTEEYRNRVIQLGEHPDHVFNVGAIGLENIRKLNLLKRKEIEKIMRFPLGEQSILVTFHPITLEENETKNHFQNLLDAIDTIPGLHVIFTKANADTEGRIINQMIDAYVSKTSQKSVSFTSMGQLSYLSAMKHVNAVVGNSSSGIIESPSLKTPTVNIGDRQKGRVQAQNIINCSANKEEIVLAVKKALSPNFRKSMEKIKNPYEKKYTAKNIIKIINKFNLNGILRKKFYDI